MKVIKAMLLGAALIAATAASAQEQYMPVLSYRVGASAAGGSGYYGGAIDYWTLVNMTGGINGVKLKWEECETEYVPSKGVECYERLKKNSGGATTVEPLSTGIAYGLFDRVAKDKIPMTTFGYGLASSADGRVYDWVFPLGTTYWNQMAAMIAYLGQKEGGLEKLKGKKIAFLYHESAFGKEPIPVLDALSTKLGFDVLKVPVPPPGQSQESQWLQIRQAKPDYVIMWTYGVMSTVALKTAAKTGFPREKLLGVWWAGSEEDVIPAGDAAKGYVSAAFSASGTGFPGGAGHQDQGLRRREGQPRGPDAPRQRDVHARTLLRHHHRRGDARRPGQVRQGQGRDARAAALGPRAPQHHRRPPQGARRGGALSRDQDELCGPRRLGHGEVPGLGRQGLQAGCAVHGGRPRHGAQDGRGGGDQVRQGQQDHRSRDCSKEG